MRRAVQGFLRLTIDGELDPAQVSPWMVEGLARAAFPDDPPPVDFEALHARVSAVAAAAHARFREIVEEPAARLPPPDEEMKAT